MPAPTREISASNLMAKPGAAKPATSSARAAAPASESPPSNPVPIEESMEARKAFAAALAAKRNPKPEAKPAEEAERPGLEGEDEEGQEAPSGEAEEGNVPRGTNGSVAAPEPKKKVSPWELLKEEKRQRAAIEQEYQKVKSGILPDQDRTTLTERVTKAETRNKELEDEIRYVNYEKSQEFAEKYQQPYVDAWNRALSDFSEISVADPISGQPRAVQESDMMELLALPLQQAQDRAEELFGKFAQTAMDHRKTLKNLLQDRNKALTEARKTGSQRDAVRQQQLQEQHKKLAGEISTTFRAINDQILADPVNSRYFKPISVQDGKQPTPEEKEWNDSLQTGYKLVEEGWGANPLAPNLTPEQRRDIIAQHAAIRNRAAAFGPLKRLTKRLEGQIAKLEKQLAQYQSSNPGMGGRQPSNQRQEVSPSDSFRDRLSKVAR
jgi:hypothetical protein